MIIKITTVRFIADGDYWPWANATLEGINIVSRSETGKNRLHSADFTKLLNFGRMEFEDDLGHTKVKTIFAIEKGNSVQ